MEDLYGRVTMQGDDEDLKRSQTKKFNDYGDRSDSEIDEGLSE